MNRAQGCIGIPARRPVVFLVARALYRCLGISFHGQPEIKVNEKFEKDRTHFYDIIDNIFRSQFKRWDLFRLDC